VSVDKAVSQEAAMTEAGALLLFEEELRKLHEE
jgi:hypothetical protein